MGIYVKGMLDLTIFVRALVRASSPSVSLQALPGGTSVANVLKDLVAVGIILAGPAALAVRHSGSADGRIPPGSKTLAASFLPSGANRFPELCCSVTRGQAALLQLHMRTRCTANTDGQPLA